MNGSGEDDVKRVTFLPLSVEAFAVPKALQPHAVGERLEILGRSQNAEEFNPTDRLDDVFPR
jgi:hypothetical protein